MADSEAIHNRFDRLSDKISSLGEHISNRLDEVIALLNRKSNPVQQQSDIPFAQPDSLRFQPNQPQPPPILPINSPPIFTPSFRNTNQFNKPTIKEAQDSAEKKELDSVENGIESANEPVLTVTDADPSMEKLALMGSDDTTSPSLFVAIESLLCSYDLRLKIKGGIHTPNISSLSKSNISSMVLRYGHRGHARNVFEKMSDMASCSSFKLCAGTLISDRVGIGDNVDCGHSSASVDSKAANSVSSYHMQWFDIDPGPLGLYDFVKICKSISVSEATVYNVDGYYSSVSFDSNALYWRYILMAHVSQFQLARFPRCDFSDEMHRVVFGRQPKMELEVHRDVFSLLVDVMDSAIHGKNYKLLQYGGFGHTLILFEDILPRRHNFGRQDAYWKPVRLLSVMFIKGMVYIQFSLGVEDGTVVQFAFLDAQGWSSWYGLNPTWYSLQFIRVRLRYDSVSHNYLYYAKVWFFQYYRVIFKARYSPCKSWQVFFFYIANDSDINERAAGIVFSVQSPIYQKGVLLRASGNYMVVITLEHTIKMQQQRLSILSDHVGASQFNVMLDAAHHQAIHNKYVIKYKPAAVIEVPHQHVQFDDGSLLVLATAYLRGVIAALTCIGSIEPGSDYFPWDFLLYLSHMYGHEMEWGERLNLITESGVSVCKTLVVRHALWDTSVLSAELDMEVSGAAVYCCCFRSLQRSPSATFHPLKSFTFKCMTIENLIIIAGEWKSSLVHCGIARYQQNSVTEFLFVSMATTTEMSITLSLDVLRSCLTLWLTSYAAAPHYTSSLQAYHVTGARYILLLCTINGWDERDNSNCFGVIKESGRLSYSSHYSLIRVPFTVRIILFLILWNEYCEVTIAPDVAKQLGVEALLQFSPEVLKQNVKVVTMCFSFKEHLAKKVAIFSWWIEEWCQDQYAVQLECKSMLHKQDQGGVKTGSSSGRSSNHTSVFDPGIGCALLDRIVGLLSRKAYIHSKSIKFKGRVHGTRFFISNFMAVLNRVYIISTFLKGKDPCQSSNLDETAKLLQFVVGPKVVVKGSNSQRVSSGQSMNALLLSERNWYWALVAFKCGTNNLKLVYNSSSKCSRVSPIWMVYSCLSDPQLVFMDTICHTAVYPCQKFGFVAASTIGHLPCIRTATISIATSFPKHPTESDNARMDLHLYGWVMASLNPGFRSKNISLKIMMWVVQVYCQHFPSNGLLHLQLELPKVTAAVLCKVVVYVFLLVLLSLECVNLMRGHQSVHMLHTFTKILSIHHIHFGSPSNFKLKFQHGHLRQNCSTDMLNFWVYWWLCGSVLVISIADSTMGQLSDEQFPLNDTWEDGEYQVAVL